MAKFFAQKHMTFGLINDLSGQLKIVTDLTKQGNSRQIHTDLGVGGLNGTSCITEHLACGLKQVRIGGFALVLPFGVDDGYQPLCGITQQLDIDHLPGGIVHRLDVLVQRRIFLILACDTNPAKNGSVSGNQPDERQFIHRISN